MSALGGFRATPAWRSVARLVCGAVRRVADVQRAVNRINDVCPPVLQVADIRRDVNRVRRNVNRVRRNVNRVRRNVNRVRDHPIARCIDPGIHDRDVRSPIAFVKASSGAASRCVKERHEEGETASPRLSSVLEKIDHFTVAL